jgi:hypothetical protein
LRLSDAVARDDTRVALAARRRSLVPHGEEGSENDEEPELFTERFACPDRPDRHLAPSLAEL